MLLQLLPLAIAAHASFSKLPTGNGWGTAVYDVAQARVVDLREHVFQSVDQGVPTRSLLYDAYFGLRAGGQQAWLTGAPVQEARLDGGVITAKQSYGGLAVTTRYFAPFAAAAPALVMAIEVENGGGQAVDDVRVFSLANAHLGDGDGTVGQRVDWDAARGAFVQRSTTSQRLMLIRPLGAPAHHAAAAGGSPKNPYDVVMGGGLLTDLDSTGDANDVASGFQWDVGTLAPGQRASFAVLLAYHPVGDLGRLSAIADAVLQNGNPPQVVAAEQAQWAEWLGRARVPPGLTDEELALYRQQLAILRMGQSREPDDVAADYLPHGQLVASLRPGHWDIAWVRDGCLAIAALARAGYLDEARAGLEFMLRAGAGGYQAYVGAPYRISVVRYFGRGKEESDSDGNGPNVELDGFGMFLWAAGEYLDGGGDPGFLDTWFWTLADGVADALAKLVEPQSGLLAADSSIWETHWDNGGRQHWAWSNLWAAVGLARAAAWADARDGVRAQRWRAASATLRNGIAAHLVDADRVLRPNTEHPGTVDAQVVEAFNQGVVDPRGPIAAATLDALKSRLFLAATGHGYKRNENGSPYDEAEWIVVDLRTAHALARAGRTDEADQLWSWVRDQATQNHGLIPELYDPKTADYAGEVPMVGFGAGAYVVTAWDRLAPPATDGGTPPPDAATTTMPTGCSCAVGAGTGPFDSGPSGLRSGRAVLLFTLLAIVCIRRRKK